MKEYAPEQNDWDSTSRKLSELQKEMSVLNAIAMDLVSAIPKNQAEALAEIWGNLANQNEQPLVRDLVRTISKIASRKE